MHTVYQLLYKVFYEIGCCIGLLTSKKSINLWIFITLIYFIKSY